MGPKFNVEFNQTEIDVCAICGAVIIRLESETLRTIRESIKSLNVRFETYASQYTATPGINKTLNTIQEISEDKDDDDENVEAKLSLTKVEGKKEWCYFQKYGGLSTRKEFVGLHYVICSQILETVVLVKNNQLLSRLF